MTPRRNILLAAASVAAMMMFALQEARGEERVRAQLAVQTTSGSHDSVAIRTALYGERDRESVNVDPVRWRGGWYGGYRGWYGGYRPYYSYGPRYYSYRPYPYYWWPGYYYGPQVTYRAPYYW